MEHTAHHMTIRDFSRLELSGVHEVLGFDESQIELSLGDFTLLIGGSELKIEAFSRDRLEIAIVGRIDSLFREEEKIKSSRSFFSRFFS